MAGMSAFGTTFKITESGDLVAVGGLTSIGGPSLSVDAIDVSAHDSPEAHREYVGGMVDAGEMSLEGNLLQGNAKLLKDAIEDRAVVAMEVGFPPYLKSANLYKFSKWAFNGFVTSLSPTAPHDGKLGFSGGVKVTGKPTLAEADIWMITFAVGDGVNDIDGASIQLYTDMARTELYSWARLTNADGEALFLLENGTYYYTVTATGFTDEDGDVIVLDANATETVTMS